MDDPSITKRLIDFGTEEHKYDDVQELPEESNNQQQLLSNISDPNNASRQSVTESDLPPELPPPKQKSVKNSKSKSKTKTKSKSKIPRSPSLASSLSNSNSNSNSNTNLSYQQQQTLSAIAPQIPPLPLNYQNKLKSMNGSSTPTTPLGNNSNSNTSTTAVTPISQHIGSNNNSSSSSNSNGNNNCNNINNNNVNNSTVNIMGGGVQLSQGTTNGTTNNHRSNSINMASRRPQIQISPIAESTKHFPYLTLTVCKDENGYGMRVSGDTPVFVESVKSGGAAQIAGLVAGDMILKVNGQEVSSEKHPTVVSLIKASNIVEFVVKRSPKLERPNSISVVPSTPILSGRDRTASITGPQPVDSIKRREMETCKIQTLQKMLEQEKLNLERLKGDTNHPSYKLSEANIRKLKEQLRQVGAEDAPTIKYQPTVSNKNTALLTPNQIHHLSASSHQQHQTNFHDLNSTQQHHNQVTTPQPQTQSSPAFLSLLPRSLSSLSLGTRKNKIDKDLITSPLNNTTDFLHTSTTGTASPTPLFNMSQSLHQPQLQQHRNSQQLFYQQQQQLLLQQRLKETPKSSNTKNKNKFAAQAKNAIQEDIPPPLPQRNPPRQLQLDVTGSNSNNNNNSALNNTTNNNHLFSPISDLDHSQITSPQRNSPQPNATPTTSATAAAQKKRSKTKTKALSDPKMSTQMFLQMETAAGTPRALFESSSTATEVDCVPPPLPPRQPGMLLEEPHKGSYQNLNATGAARPPPNSIDTLLNYPLVSTCTPVHRDNMAAAFPLSNRPNIVQQLQQHQQQQQQQQQQLHGVAAATNSTTAAALGQSPHNHLNKHRRVVSSPENMHPRHPDRLNKTTSGSWELVEKDGEVTPPGTPPPPYLTAQSPNTTGMEESNDHINSSGIFVESHHFTPLSGAASPLPQTAVAHSSRIQAAQTSATQKEIISMEDEDASDQEGPFIDENGPFNYLQRLLEAENVAFLAVFLNYVLSNSEPAPLLFYLITGLYREGTAKDMRKWAYEIHSTFLVPRAPLAWYRQDESLAREVDNVLQSEFDKVEILRKVFWKSRRRARYIICEQLREFQQKRTAGLGTIYGPTDAQLAEAKGDKQREQHIFEETLMRQLQTKIEEYEKDLAIEDPKKLALCSALSTVIHRIFITRSHPNSIIDRVHHFVSREKSFKARLMGKNRKMMVRGHPLVLRQYYEVTHCNHCQTIIWGVSPQGYHCTDCKLNIHRPCSKVLDENCPGPLPQAKQKKEPHNDNKISKIMGKIRPRTSSDFIAMEKRARQDEDTDPADFANERVHSTSIMRQPSDRRPDAANISLRSNGNTSHNSSDLQSSFHATTAADTSGVETLSGAGASGGIGNVGGITAAGTAIGADVNAQDAAEGKDARRERLHQQHQQNKSAPVSVNRSESYKERLSHKRNRNSRRKTSDPSLTSRPNDDQADVGLSNSNYTASSNSSLSSGGGSESPSTSMEQVGGAGGGGTAAQSTAHHSTTHHPHHTHQHSHQDSFHGSIGGSSSNASFWSSSAGGTAGPTIAQLARPWNIDSDEDDDYIEADWSSNVAADMLAALTDAEKKRQEIINEIYQTERSHVRTLKLLDRLFFCPLQEGGVLSNDHLMLLFPPALPALRDLHNAFEQKLKQRRVEHNHIVGHVGDLLAGMFDGQSGEELREYAAQFCARQQIALEALKEKRRKDEQLQKILSKAESHKACRRLQLKDLLPTVLQRLTKYPLLFENLYKVTIRVVPENTTEAEAIQRALESSKKILVDVNQAVKTAEDAHKLQNIQRKLDKSFDKDEFKNLDLTQYRLIHDGSLTMKKNPSIQLHGLLFDSMIVLLTKQDDKYSLKYLHAARNTEVNNKPVRPIMNIDSETLVRQEAADKNSFFLIKTRTSQMLELRAPSSSECKTWFKHISDAAEQYKPRSKNANQEPVDDPAIATLPHSNTKESLELTPERPPPIAATATVTTTPLAPMMPPASASMVSTLHSTSNNNNIDNVQLRQTSKGVRVECTLTPTDNSGIAQHKQRLSHNELSPAASSVNRTMSTRSCGEANNNYGTDNASNVTLRHTQSARQANAADGMDPNNTGLTINGGANKRDSGSILYSNNSNNTHTLMQSSPPLVEPTAIQISISPAHTAEPVLTPAERLRRLDAAIRDGLLEKQKIICDMFRLPVEHFHEIVDIAAMPEAPKDSSDIALAAYAQVQSLTEVLNDYMIVTHEQEISAVSTAVCDQCHEKQQRQRHTVSSSTTSTSSSTCSSNSASTTTLVAATAQQQSPPPLPPPNKQTAQAQQQTTVVTKLHTPVLLEADIHEDDDGYCQIDELRLPALPRVPPTAGNAQAASPPPPLPPPAGTFKTPPPPPPPPANAKVAAPTPTAQVQSQNQTQAATATAPVASAPELVKRQSTISADSIPEESADEVTKALDEEFTPTAAKTVEPTTPLAANKESNIDAETTNNKVEENHEIAAEDQTVTAADSKINAEEQPNNAQTTNTNEANDQLVSEKLVTNADEMSASAVVETQNNEEQAKLERTADDELQQAKENQTEKEAENNEVDNALVTLSKLSSALTMVDSMTQTMPLLNALNINSIAVAANAINGNTSSLCGRNRIQHANSLEPSVPCHALNSIVSALNAQISLLLPKINERDMERERLRKENQHLRELLNAMHERQRVEDKLETPNNITSSTDADDEIDATINIAALLSTSQTTAATAEDLTTARTQETAN